MAALHTTPISAAPSEKDDNLWSPPQTWKRESETSWNVVLGHSSTSSPGNSHSITAPVRSESQIVTQDIASLTQSLPTLEYSNSSRPRKPASESDNGAEINTQHEPPSYPPTIVIRDTVVDHSESQNREFRRKANIHFAALCWFMFSEGWNDGTPGPLLPAMQQTYQVM